MPPRKPKKEVQPQDQYTPLTGADLASSLKLKKDKVNDLRTKRNYIQQDRDKVEQFYLNTAHEIESTNVEILNKESAMEQLESNHRVEVKVYLQRVKHLQYQLQRTDIDIERDGNDAKLKEKTYFQRRTEKMKEEKKLYKENYTKFQKNYILTSDDLEKEQRLAEQVNRKQNKTILGQLQNKYQLRYQRLIEDLELKLKVEQHELQERKNLHINELVRNFEQAFANLKAYNNETTSDNLRLIKEHRAQIKKLNEQAANTKRLIAELTESNKNEKGPLQKLKKKKADKMLKLKYFQKEKNSLQNYKSKLHVLKEKKIKLHKDRKELDDQIERLQKIKQNLQTKFAKMTHEVKKHAQLKNIILNQRLQSLVEKLEEKEVNMARITQISSIDPGQIEDIRRKVYLELEEKNNAIRNLQYTIHHATKAYNDAIRVYQTKLVEFGIPEEELGFQPLQTPTSTMPAGLVAS